MPTMGETNKENFQLQTNILSNTRTLRKANLSGEDGDFSISSMSDSSHRANKSSLNKTNSGGGNQTLGKIFGKNYFVDGE